MDAPSCPSLENPNTIVSMPRSKSVLISLLTITSLLAACSKKQAGDQVLFTVPTGFSGQVQVQLGVVGAAPLEREHGVYVLRIPADGKLTTSTVLPGSPSYNVSGDNQVWGYTSSIYRTGDGLPVGGNLEFFIGTREQFDAYEAKKPKSQDVPDQQPDDSVERQQIALS
jgi:hypothetical protein